MFLSVTYKTQQSSYNFSLVKQVFFCWKSIGHFTRYNIFVNFFFGKMCSKYHRNELIILSVVHMFQWSLINSFNCLFFDDDEKRCLFATQIIEHTAYSLLIRVDNGFKMWTRYWVLVKWSSLLIKHYFRNSFLQCILNMGRE